MIERIFPNEMKYFGVEQSTYKQCKSLHSSKLLFEW